MATSHLCIFCTWIVIQKFFISTNNKFGEETALEELWNYWILIFDRQKPREINETS